MGEFLKQYGGIVVAFIVGSCLLFFVAFGQDASRETFDGVMSKSILNQNYEDINKIIQADSPKLELEENLTVGVGDDFELSDVIISAYGNANSSAYSFNILTNDGKISISDIKDKMIAGKINVVYHEDFTTDKAGNYTIDFYVKNSTKDGIWIKKTCHIFVEDYA